LFIAASAIAFLVGCASQSISPSAPVVVPVAAEPAAAVASTPHKPSVPPGYKAVERNGTTLYCTRVASLGTKFKQEVCMTQDEYDELQRRGESVRQDLRQTTKMCGGGSGFGSCNGS
jgi:hypothetical protein